MYRNLNNPRKNFKYFFIYCITNQINFKKYIGQHAANSLSIEEDTYMGSGKLLKKAIKKYGINNFKREIIEICEKEEYLNDKEIFWIKELKTNVSYGGYNLTFGGEGNRGFKMSSETKQLISKKKKGKSPWNKGKTNIYSDESLLKMKNSQLNKTISKNTTLKISQSNTGKKRTEEQKLNYTKSKIGDLNPAKIDSTRLKISNSRKNKGVGKNNSMYNSKRSRDKLNVLEGVELKGDRWEYLRNKIKCINIKTNEEFILDGVKEVLEFLKISKNKYYNHIKTRELINDQYICTKM